MAKEQRIQLVSGHVSPAGDQWTEIYRSPHDPLTWPEVLVLRTLHGDDAVRGLRHAGETERTAKDERERLTRLYGSVVQQVFPGSSPRMEANGGDEVEDAEGPLPELEPKAAGEKAFGEDRIVRGSQMDPEEREKVEADQNHDGVPRTLEVEEGHEMPRRGKGK